MTDEIEKLQMNLRRFAKARDWEQFHSPKNLAISISIEAAEILENFQWLTDEQSRNLPQEKLDLVANEIADVMIYLLQLSDKLKVDPISAAISKIENNEKRYPANLAKGNSKKYTEL